MMWIAILKSICLKSLQSNVQQSGILDSLVSCHYAEMKLYFPIHNVGGRRTILKVCALLNAINASETVALGISAPNR